ncbi:WD40 repeat domain-containing protein [Phormidium nigroviride]
MKHWSLSLLALFFFGAMVLSHVSRGFSALEDRANRYSVSGSRSGTVTVTETASGKVIRTFQMDSGVVVRETFILDGGRTVAASQKDHAVFWDLETGREIRRFPQRIYGFSPDETKFFTYESPGHVFLYAYPTAGRICKLVEVGYAGPAEFQFAPNSRFLVIYFLTGMPGDDRYYPYPNPDYWRISITIKLFNLQSCQDIQEFSDLRLLSLGEFSVDSKFYYLKNTRIRTEPSNERGSWQFNLETYKIRRLTN